MESFASLHAFADIGLLALRIAVGVIFWVHGAQKLPAWREQASADVPAGKRVETKFLSIVEPLGAVAVLAGFLTQMAAAGLGLIMVGAIGLKAGVRREPFSDPKAHKVGWEYNFILLAATVALFLAGAGNISLDHYLFGI